MDEELYQKALQDIVVSAHPDEPGKNDVPALMVMNALISMSGKSATETDLMASTRKFPRQFVAVVAGSAILTMLTIAMQLQVCEQVRFPTCRIGACFTLFGSTTALTVLLLRLYYAQQRRDGITRTLSFAFQCSIGTIVFGMALWLLGIYWAIDPTFLVPELTSIPIVQRLLDGTRIAPVQVVNYLGLCSIIFWPVVALSYCAVRFALGALWQSLRTRDSKAN